MRIGIVAGEASGDILGAGLLAELKSRFPNALFAGIGGELMLAQGFDSLFPQERLAVMGLIEPLKRLPELLSIRRQLYKYFVQENFDVVVGIDSPDFNLNLEKKLRLAGIKTVHYVSPSVWAWRQGRIQLIKAAVDHMLTLLPFEADFYKQHQIPVTFVGHPLADKFPITSDIDSARKTLSELISRDLTGKKVIACLPGSRATEIKHIAPLLIQAMEQLATELTDIVVVIPALNTSIKQEIESQLQDSQFSVSTITGYSHQVMSAADCVVMASGTTTLEALLLKKPMVVVYKKDWFSYQIISRMLKIDHISLPNLLANKSLVPELLQGAATPSAISQAVQYWLNHPNEVKSLQQEFINIHQGLKQQASCLAANAVVNLLDNKKQNES